MPAKIPKPMVGEQFLAGMPEELTTPEPISPLPDLIRDDSKVTFGRVVMPYFLGINAESFSGISDEAISAADPDKFKPYLFPMNGGEFVVDSVALHSAEYNRLVRYPKPFKTAVNNLEYDRRRLDPDTERRTSEANEKEKLELGRKSNLMQATLDGIRQEQEAIELLKKEARSPGYAHARTKDMRAAVINVHDVVFPRILEVVGREKNWTNNQAELARQAVGARLFSEDFHPRQRVSNWRAMLRVANMYGKRRESLFSDRIERVNKILGTYTVRASR